MTLLAYFRPFPACGIWWHLHPPPPPTTISKKWWLSRLRTDQNGKFMFNREKNVSHDYHTMKALVKYWWNWHLDSLLQKFNDLINLFWNLSKLSYRSPIVIKGFLKLFWRKIIYLWRSQFNSFITIQHITNK